MFGKITSLVGSNMQSFALSLFVLNTTGSATKFASILAVALIPQLILGPFAGVIVDWFYKKYTNNFRFNKWDYSNYFCN